MAGWGGLFFGPVSFEEGKGSEEDGGHLVPIGPASFCLSRANRQASLLPSDSGLPEAEASFGNNP